MHIKNIRVLEKTLINKYPHIHTKPSVDSLVRNSRGEKPCLMILHVNQTVYRDNAEEVNIKHHAAVECDTLTNMTCLINNFEKHNTI